MRPTLPAARDSSQLAAIAESLVTDAERGNRRVTCLLHIISDGTRVGHAQGITLSILRAFIACAAAVQTAVLVARSPYLGMILQGIKLLGCFPRGIFRFTWF